MQSGTFAEQWSVVLTKGLFITTGTFTADAKREATRDGAPAIDLIDGDYLCDLLKSFKLGVATRMVEEVEIEPEWFASNLERINGEGISVRLAEAASGSDQ